MAHNQQEHVFIIRIVHERREIEGAEPRWRAMVEHLPSNSKRHFESLASLTEYIAERAEIIVPRLPRRTGGS